MNTVVVCLDIHTYILVKLKNKTQKTNHCRNDMVKRTWRYAQMKSGLETRFVNPTKLFK